MTSLPMATPAGREVLERWSNHDLPDWEKNGKGTAPRILLTKLANQVDLEAANAYLCAISPWSGAGSSWAFHKGDYDFTLVTLTTLLYMYGNQPDRLYPETRDHLLGVLLNQDGGHPLVTAPRTFGLILDTDPVPDGVRLGLSMGEEEIRRPPQLCDGPSPDSLAGFLRDLANDPRLPKA